MTTVPPTTSWRIATSRVRGKLDTDDGVVAGRN